MATGTNLSMFPPGIEPQENFTLTKVDLDDDNELPGLSCKNAFCTLVMFNESYIKGALVLGSSLLRHCPGVQRVCLVTPDIPEGSVEALLKVFHHVVKVGKCLR
eukprot:GHVU01131025.1.p2 GENE.GHVU01131025.1~~GHVU01131025.1.p2  ORF type:complete len:104 (+),score=2.14 GHVU01131025.1:326-637(+)